MGISFPDRKKLRIIATQHCYDRLMYWDIKSIHLKDTIRTGRIVFSKCRTPDIFCMSKYYGKENATLIVIVKRTNRYIKVITAWPKQGR